jgi:hypothetical protein
MNWMEKRIRIIKHEAIPDCGSFEVKILGEPSQYFYWDDNAGRRLRPDAMTQEQALEAAKAFARSKVNPTLD